MEESLLEASVLIEGRAELKVPDLKVDPITIEVTSSPIIVVADIGESGTFSELDNFVSLDEDTDSEIINKEVDTLLLDVANWPEEQIFDEG